MITTSMIIFQDKLVAECIHNVSILDLIGTSNDGSGGDYWSYKTRKATNQHTAFYRPGVLPVA